VDDVFISRRRNQRRKKFGFVRFQGVSNVYTLER